MRIYANIPTKFHPDPIWNRGALGFFWEEVAPNKKNKNKMSTKAINSWSKNI